MLTLFGGTITQPLSDTGSIVVGGKLYFYVAGSPSTPKDTYADADGDTANSNPVELDGAGRAVIFLADDGAYDIEFQDADGNTLWTLTSVVAAAPVV